MNLKKTTCLFLVLFFAGSAAADECTTAVVSAAAGRSGRPILWKNRDTGVLSNRVVYVKGSPYSYIGLVDKDSLSGRMCFAGLNSEGFAIMNSVAYNLPQKSDETKNMEGIIMADALRTCRTAADFEHYLRRHMGPDFGCLANFGVFGADGKAKLFEVHNNGYYVVDPDDSPEKYLVNTNFSRNGEADRGHGYIRFERASALFRGFPHLQVDYRTILQRFTRDTANGFAVQPNVFDLDSLPADSERWIDTTDSIDRPSTAAAVVLVGGNDENPETPATMWVIPGEPVTAIALPLWVEAGGVPECLWKGDEAPMWKESLRIKSLIRGERKGHMHDYLNLTRLDNAAKTGYLPLLLETETAIFVETEAFLKTKPGSGALREFQEKTAEKALAVLKKIR